MKRKAFIFFSIIVLGVTGYVFFTFLEKTPPTGEWLNRSEYLSKEVTLKVSASDTGQGLRMVEVAYLSGDQTFPLYSEDYSDSKPALGMSTFEVPIDFKKLGVDDGEGVIVVNIQDRSFWNFGLGNSTRLEYGVVIDTEPPMVEILSTDHVVLQGGSEVTVYKVSTDTVTTGVKVGDHFFPGQSGASKDRDTYVAFFSYPYNLPVGKPLFILAQDRAGNTVRKSLPILVKPKRYRKRTIKLSEGFLKRKMPEVMSFANIKESGDPLKDFLLVNNELRSQQEKRIMDITRESAPELKWKEGFLQLKNAKVESKFADFRTYIYNGKTVDKKYHLGFDLAATKRSPIGASNAGLVVLAGNLGIYGTSVIIDHGFGIFTLYSHMSSIDIKEGDAVGKGEIIGRTGETGLAGGDHLHFGILIHGTPVTPIEWWDGQWVENRILRRLRAVGD